MILGVVSVTVFRRQSRLDNEVISSAETTVCCKAAFQTGHTASCLHQQKCLTEFREASMNLNSIVVQPTTALAPQALVD